MAAFLQRRIGFLTISEVAEQVLEDFLNSHAGTRPVPITFEEVYDLDRWQVRQRTLEKLRIAA